jgi:plastocyanin
MSRKAAFLSRVILGTALVLAVGVTARRFIKPAQGAGSGAEVTIDNFSFAPATLTVAAGTQVTWTNRDDIPHTVVNTDKVFKSKVLDSEEKFAFTLDKPGTYQYFCSLHPKMTGTIVVK